jgi:hypothetical protein
MRDLRILVGVLLLAGCAATPPQRAAPIAEWRADTDVGIAACAERFVRLDDAVDAAGVRDGATARVPGYPQLRTDRFLAGEARHPARDAVALLAAMRSLDREARQHEIADLPDGALLHLGDADRRSLVEAVEACGARLLARTTDAALDRASVPDDYATWKRVAGVYAIARVPFAAGVRGYQRETARTFATPLDRLPVTRALVRHVPPVGPPGHDDFAALAPFAEVAPEVLAAWFARHAPVLEIDTASDADLPGAPIRTAEGHVDVDVAQPVMYTRLVHTRFAGRVLPQLVYSVWFPARPKQGTFDLLGGRLDGITWRVTLGPDGTPWIHDTMHNCGCYHQFFPTPAVREKPPAPGLDEGAFVPQHLPVLPRDGRLVLRVAAVTHYLQRVIVERGVPAGAPIAFAPDDTLRSLTDPQGGRRSLFRPDGIVPGTERGERWLFWPMGVAEPGAMRQWGRHATAFVGRRHFDEAGLLDRYFEVASPGAP